MGCAPHRSPRFSPHTKSNAGDYFLLRPLRVVLRDDCLAVLRFLLGTFVLFFVIPLRLVLLDALFLATRREEEDLLPLNFFEAPLRLAPKSLVFLAARTVERAALAAAWAPLATCCAVRLTSRITGLPLSARLPSTAPTIPPIAAPTGPATAPTTAPVAAPAVDLLTAGIAMVSSVPGTFFLEPDFLAIGFVTLREPVWATSLSTKDSALAAHAVGFPAKSTSQLAPSKSLSVANFARKLGSSLLIREARCALTSGSTASLTARA